MVDCREKVGSRSGIIGILARHFRSRIGAIGRSRQLSAVADPQRGRRLERQIVFFVVQFQHKRFAAGQRHRTGVLGNTGIVRIALYILTLRGDGFTVLSRQRLGIVQNISAVELAYIVFHRICAAARIFGRQRHIPRNLGRKVIRLPVIIPALKSKIVDDGIRRFFDRAPIRNALRSNRDRIAQRIERYDIAVLSRT